MMDIGVLIQHLLISIDVIALNIASIMKIATIIDKKATLDVSAPNARMATPPFLDTTVLNVNP